jgi:hypothetical protein
MKTKCPIIGTGTCVEQVAASIFPEAITPIRSTEGVRASVRETCVRHERALLTVQAADRSAILVRSQSCKTTATNLQNFRGGIDSRPLPGDLDIHEYRVKYLHLANRVRQSAFHQY